MRKLLGSTLALAAMCFTGAALADGAAQTHYDTLAMLEGDWKLSPPEQQEGGATKKGPAAKLLNTDATAMSFKVIGKGSTVQENLLPGTGKEMATMYHCDSFKQCGNVVGTHYCAKQNQPKLVLDKANSSEQTIVMTCDMQSELCNSAEGHVHMIKHELSNDRSHLKTSYVIFQDNAYQKTSIYHFDRK